MAVPVSQMYTVTKYVLTQKLRGVKRYPLCSCSSRCFAVTSPARDAARFNILIMFWTNG